MTNHLHLLLTPDSAGAISRLFQECGRQYVVYINRTYHRRGTLWEGRHKGIVIESSAYLLACMRYIELNPVRAGIAVQPEHYRWSSYKANALGDDNCILAAHEDFLLLGPTPERRREAYRGLFDSGLSLDELERIRNCTQSGTPMGSEGFKARIEKLVQRPVGAERRGRPARTSASDARQTGE
jgi:putative transposase